MEAMMMNLWVTDGGGDDENQNLLFSLDTS